MLGRGPGPNGFAYDVANGLWSHQVDNSAEGFLSQVLVAGPDLLLLLGGEDTQDNNSKNVLKRRALRLARDGEDGEFEMVTYQEERIETLHLFFSGLFGCFT